MKYTFLITAALATTMLVSCGEKKSDEKSETAASADSGASENTVENAEASEAPEGSNKAVLLWNAGTISAPSSKDGKWVASYQFGNTLTLTGKREENTTEKRTYVEVTGPDGKTGWINEYMVATGATVGVATGDIPLYKNPDIMSVSSDKIKLGDIIAISTEEKDGFRMVYGKEKKIKGYVNSVTKVSADPNDLKVAVFYHQALTKKTPDEQLVALRAITEDETNAGSKVYSVVLAKIVELGGAEIPDEPEPGDMSGEGDGEGDY